MIEILLPRGNMEGSTTVTFPCSPEGNFVFEYSSHTFFLFNIRDVEFDFRMGCVPVFIFSVFINIKLAIYKCLIFF